MSTVEGQKPLKTVQMGKPGNCFPGLLFVMSSSKIRAIRTEAQEIAELVTLLIGKTSEARAMHDGEYKTRGEGGRFVRRDKNCPTGEPGRTSEKIAEELGISPGTVKNAVSFTKGVDALRKISPEAAAI